MDELSPTGGPGRPRRAVAHPDLAELRALYEAGDRPVAEVIQQSGLSQKQFYTLVRQFGWTGRRPRDPFRPRPPKTAKLCGRAAVVRRIWAAADAQMREIEQRIQSLGESDGAAAERDARVMGTLVKTLRDLVALDGEMKASQQKDGATDAGSSKRDDLRQELGRRLARLRAERRGA
jgi:hypothetical protein